MYLLCFDLNVSELKKHYGEPYNKAYFDIKKLLVKLGFEWIQGSSYILNSDDMSQLLLAVMELKKLKWFCKSVKDIRGSKMESWSNFTPILQS